jgi:carboxyl-terminal processing protease
MKRLLTALPSTLTLVVVTALLSVLPSPSPSAAFEPRSSGERVSPKGRAYVGVARPAQPGPALTTVALPSPQVYLQFALDFIENQSLARKSVAWEQLRSAAEQSGKQARTIDETYPIINRTLAGLKDKHASFRPPVRATEITQGVANGYGFLASWPSRVVVSITDGGPAATAGLQLGDRIELVEGRQPKPARNAVAIPQKTKVINELRVTVTRKSAATRTAKRINLTIKKGAFTLVSTPKQDPAIVKTVGNSIGYIELPGLLGTEEDQRIYAMQAHESIRQTSATPRCGWVIDVRRNRGGWVYPILAAAGTLYQPGPNGVVMGKVDAAGITERWSYRDGNFNVNRPGAQPEDYTVFSVANPFQLTTTTPGSPPAVAVLMSSLTASAGEALVLAFRGQPAFRSFGEPTLGLTTFDSVGTLPDGAIILVSNAAMTDRTLVAQDGPISPDIAVAPDWNHVGDAEDPILRAATMWLGEQESCQK